MAELPEQEIQNGNKSLTSITQCTYNLFSMPTVLIVFPIMD